MRAALRSAPPLPLSREIVLDCVNSENERAQEQEQTFRDLLGSPDTGIVGHRSGSLNGVTGHIAESVAAVLLDEVGYVPLEHFPGPFSGGHGIDLAMFSPETGSVVVVEVKGTLQRKRWPRLTTGEAYQMSPEWLDKPDNPGMSNLEFTSADVHAAVVLISFVRMQWKCVVSAGFDIVHPISTHDDLCDLTWAIGEQGTA
ncbi:hypothetical protein C5613_21975 [Rhodococcus opacus]|uniref:Uncharacterized protein n=2 Tax=Rhodococcus opacus TaxID=37919 RepID=A0A2S8J6U5_RHOOP|nr:hypothetical protein C5613_21975 [Rhodococcus opacus]